VRHICSSSVKIRKLRQERHILDVAPLELEFVLYGILQIWRADGASLQKIRNTILQLRVRTIKIWTAAAERSGDTAFRAAGCFQKRRASRSAGFPPQSKICGCGQRPL
jgi:hypothetical protein